MHRFPSGRILIIPCALVCLLPMDRGQAAEPVEANILLVGGTLVDGTGAAPRRGNVAIRGDRIVGVGEVEVTGHPQVIDCKGLIVAPGFIDLHNHSDKGILDPKMRAHLNSLIQGCTTVVTGNCGAGPLDTAEYYAAIDKNGAGTNVAHLLAHGSLRELVIGSNNRSATSDEIKQMQESALRAMQDGAWGMSTGLIYVPGSYADTDELVAIAEVIGQNGGFYASHMRNEGAQLLAAVEELLEIGRRAELPVHVSHFKSSGEESWGLIRQASQMIEKARSQGQTVTADQYPYTASSTSLAATILKPTDRAGGHEELVQRLDDPQSGPRIRAHIAEVLSRKQDGVAIRIARYASRPDWVGQNLNEIATAENLTPVDLCLQIFRTGEAQIVNFCMCEEDVRFGMQIPWVATASDGRTSLPGPDRPHPRYYGTFARKIGYYSLRERVISLEQAIRSCTGLPADILKMTDRGYLKSGQFADIVVFDPEKFIDTATFDDPHRYATGVQSVFVNGTPAVSEGKPTGALAGRALRRSQRKASE